MPEVKTRFIPKPRTTVDSDTDPRAQKVVPYYGTGLSGDIRHTSVGAVNPKLYGEGLRQLCRANDTRIAQAQMRVKVDDVTNELNRVRDLELEGLSGHDTDSVCSDADPRWQFRDTKMQYTGSLDGAKRAYFELEDIDDRTDMGPVTDPINGYCYLCTTQEEHRNHLKSEKKVRGAKLKQYSNPVRPEFLPSKPFFGDLTEGGGQTPAQNKARYKVVVKTGNEHSCGTDAQVTLKMYGPKHKTPKMVLRKPSAKFMFMRESTNTFSLTARDFPEISAIEVETDGREKSQCWYLDSIHITNMKTGKAYYFPCFDWLSLYHKGETLVRKLSPHEHQEVSREYEVTVVTGAHKHSGNDSKVYLTLVGSQGHRSKKFPLTPKDGHAFQRGAVDTFPLESKDIGPLTKIRIEHDDKGKSRRWLLLIVHIKDLYNGRQHLFYCNQWLINEEGNAIWREIPASKVPKGFNLGSWGGSHGEGGGEVLYEVNVHTGDVNFAGTDANIRIQLYGDKAHSKSVNLTEIRGNYDNPFEKNQIDIFQLKAADVGDISKIKIGHDNHGVAAGWYLEKVLVRKFLDVRTRVPVESNKKDKSKDKHSGKKNKKKDKGKDSSESATSSSESESEEETGSYVIGRNQVSSRSSKKTKSEKSKRRDSKDARADSVSHAVTRRQMLDAAISDSDKDVDDSELLSEDSDDDLGSATDLQKKSDLDKRKKAKQQKNRRRMDNLSDVAEISEASGNTSLWDSDEMPVMDKRLEVALRLKQEHDKLAETMEKIVPMVEEYTFTCKQWFAESEGDGKLVRVLRVTDKKVYNRR